MLSRDEYLAAWSRWHGDTDTARPLVRGWLTAAWTLARPLAGLPPVVATAFGLLVAAAALVPAAAGGAWLIAAGVLVGLSGLLDSLDGALAIGTGRASRRGFVLDSVVDRLSEAPTPARCGSPARPAGWPSSSAPCAGCPTTCGHGQARRAWGRPGRCRCGSGPPASP